MLYIIFLILIIIIFTLFNNSVFKETFNNCPFNYENEMAFCNNTSKPCKKCPYQRPNLTFFPQKNCCKNICNLNHKNINKKNVYWCGSMFNCWKKFADVQQNKTCNINNLTGQFSPIYSSKNICEKNINPCKNLNRLNCLHKTNCGWCTDNNGNGKCVMGGPDRPTDLIKYNYCFPNITTGINSYIGGENSTFIKQNFNDNKI